MMIFVIVMVIARMRVIVVVIMAMVVMIMMVMIMVVVIVRRFFVMIGVIVVMLAVVVAFLGVSLGGQCFGRHSSLSRGIEARGFDHFALNPLAVAAASRITVARTPPAGAVLRF